MDDSGDEDSNSGSGDEYSNSGSGDEDSIRGSEDEDSFQGFGDGKDKRSKYWNYFDEINVNGVRYAKCNLCIDKVV